MWLSCGIMEEGNIRLETTGTPQGGVISPLLSNVYLHWLDHQWNQWGFNRQAKLLRYADDFIILCEKRPEFYMSKVQHVVDRLGLTINSEKSKIADLNQGECFDCLGCQFDWRVRRAGKRPNAQYSPSRKAMKAMKSKITQLVRQRQHVKLPNLVEELNPVLRGWGNYFVASQCREKFGHIDTHVHYTLCIMLRTYVQGAPSHLRGILSHNKSIRLGVHSKRSLRFF